jgi:hypothetical protein
MSAPGAIATKVPQKTNTWRHQGTVPFLLRNHLQAPDFFGTGIDGSKTWKEAVTFIDLSRENSEVDFECASKKMKIIFKKRDHGCFIRPQKHGEKPSITGYLLKGIF